MRRFLVALLAILIFALPVLAQTPAPRSQQGTLWSGSQGTPITAIEQYYNGPVTIYLRDAFNKLTFLDVAKSLGQDSYGLYRYKGTYTFPGFEGNDYGTDWRFSHGFTGFFGPPQTSPCGSSFCY